MAIAGDDAGCFSCDGAFEVPVVRWISGDYLQAQLASGNNGERLEALHEIADLGFGPTVTAGNFGVAEDASDLAEGRVGCDQMELPGAPSSQDFARCAFCQDAADEDVGVEHRSNHAFLR